MCSLKHSALYFVLLDLFSHEDFGEKVIVGQTEAASLLAKFKEINNVEEAAFIKQQILQR